MLNRVEAHRAWFLERIDEYFTLYQYKIWLTKLHGDVPFHADTAGISPYFVKKYWKTFSEQILYFTRINPGKHIIFSFQ